MKAYLCVYRHPRPPDRDLARTEEAASGNPALRRYLDAYGHGDSFTTGAMTRVSSLRRSSWATRETRRGASADRMFGRRSALAITSSSSVAGNLQGMRARGSTTSSALRPLAKGCRARRSGLRSVQRVPALLQRPRTSRWQRADADEFVHRFHDNWRERAHAPYWPFDANHTGLNLTSPLLLATYDGEPGQIERWHTSDDRVRDLRSMLLRGARPSRGLRSTNIWQPHAKLNLSNGYGTDGELRELRMTLLELAEE